MHFQKHVMYWEFIYSLFDISEMRINMYFILKMVPVVWEAYPYGKGIIVAELVYCSWHSLRYILYSLAIESLSPYKNCFYKTPSDLLWNTENIYLVGNLWLKNMAFRESIPDSTCIGVNKIYLVLVD